MPSHWSFIVGRRIGRWMLLIAPVCLLVTGSISALVRSDNYLLPGGSLSGGGGSSEGDIYSVIGAIPMAAAGPLQQSAQYETYTGVMPISLAYFVVDFNLAAIDTVPATDLPITVFFSGGGGEATGQIHYRLGGDTVYTVDVLNRGGTDTLRYTFTLDHLTLRGLEYYLTVNRGVSRTIASDSTPFELVVGVSNDQARTPFSLPAERYQIVGVPLQLGSASDGNSVLGDDLGTGYKFDWRLGRWNSDEERVVEHPDSDPIIPGRGYWLISKNARPFGAGGLSVRAATELAGDRYLEIPLDSGWNQIANPFAFCVNWDQVVFTVNDTVVSRDTTILEDVFYDYGDAGFAPETGIGPWRGGFVHINRPGVSALFPAKAGDCGSARRTSETSAAAAGQWTLELALSARGVTDGHNSIGFLESALCGRDEHDLSKPPPAPDAPWLALRLPDRDDRYFRTDFRPMHDSLERFELVFSDGTDRTLDATGIDDLPASSAVKLVLDVGPVFDLREHNPVRLPNDSRGAHLLVGVPGRVDAEVSNTLPDSYELLQNFPNPFNPSTAIRFGLPQSGRVQLTVYNALAQEVVTLLDGDLAAGRYTVEWDGRSGTGTLVASGVYFYRLTSGDFTESRKMILVK